MSTSALPEHLDPAQIDAEVRARMAAGEDLYHLDEGALRDLAPDLVITQDLCAVCAVDVATVDAALDHLGCDGTVLTVDPATLPDVLDSITHIGAATGRATRRTPGERSAGPTGSRRRSGGRQAPPSVAVVEWTAPLFCAGHWVPDMITAAGAVCALGEPGQRSHPISPDALGCAAPDLIVVAPCGYDLAGATALAVELVGEAILPPGVPVWAVDADAALSAPAPAWSTGSKRWPAFATPGSCPSAPELAASVPAGPTSAITG